MTPKELLQSEFKDILPTLNENRIRGNVEVAMELYASEVCKEKQIIADDNKKKSTLLVFMTYYKNNVPIGTQKSSIDIVNEYLNGK